MTFEKKKIAWLGMMILAILATCFVLCGAKAYNPAERPYEAAEISKCQGLANSFETLLRVQGAKLIEDSKGKIPEFLEITPKVKLLKCINDTRVKIQASTSIKVKLELIDPKTKKKVIRTLCGTTDETMFLQQKGAFVYPETAGKKPTPINLTPCE
jgi:hypothetical protein